MRMRVARENQDESKRPLKRRRTRQGTLRKPSSTTKDTTRNHQSTDNAHGQHVPPSKKTPPSLKHAESVRNATVTRDSRIRQLLETRQDKRRTITTENGRRVYG